jgi:hypothetical protein
LLREGYGLHPADFAVRNAYFISLLHLGHYAQAVSYLSDLPPLYSHSSFIRAGLFACAWGQWPDFLAIQHHPGDAHLQVNAI